MSQSSPLDHDSTLRPLFKRHLRAQQWPTGYRLADELNVRNSRIDVALIADDLHGFEIKAERDTPARFFLQAVDYQTTFGSLTLVTTLRKAERMRASLPSFWGLIACCEEQGQIAFWQVKQAEPNPFRGSKHLLRMLWSDECLEFLLERCAAKGCRSNRTKMVARILEIGTDAEILTHVCACLKARVRWRDADGIKIAHTRESEFEVEAQLRARLESATQRGSAKGSLFGQIL